MKGIIAAIDIGTTKVCTLIGKINNNHIEILGKGVAACSGVKKGIIADLEGTAISIKNSISQAEAMSQLKVGSAFINIAGAHVNVINNRSTVNISHKNREIIRQDVEGLLYEAGNVSVSEDREIIDVVVRQFILDGYEQIADPVGMSGVKLEVDADIVAGKITSVQNIVKTIEKLGIKIDGLVVEALATGEVSLTSDERDIGVIMLDIGGGVTDISVFKKNRLIFYDSVPVGGEHITNDISIALRTSNAEAEKVKKNYELALTSLIKNDQEVIITDSDDNRKKSVKVSEIVEIIEARVHEIFTLSREQIAKSGIYESIGAGVVLTGGGISYFDGVKEIGTEVFGLPVKIANYKAYSTLKPEHAVAAGIIKHMAGQGKESTVKVYSRTQKSEVIKKDSGLFDRILKFFKEFF